MSAGLIEENVARVLDRIATAAAKAGRLPSEITLVGVCKYFGSEVTQWVANAGICDLGENRPQQLWEKAQSLQQYDIRWHQIGHLQRNKVRRTIPLIALLHAGDSLRLLKEVHKESLRLGQRTPVLLEVNVSGEQAKHGFEIGEMEEVPQQCVDLTGLEVRGLMAMAGLQSGLEGAKREFEELASLRERLMKVKPESVDLSELSMGMSRDYDIAIEQGATIVRVGSSLFEGLPRE